MLLFPPFRLDLGDARLWRGKLALILKPKSFAVLHYLVAHAGRLVSKQEFLDTVWGDVHVGDAVLKAAIKDVRRVLGDRIEAPRFVATVHRRGYRFIAPVITTDPAADVRVEPPAPPTAKLDHREAERRQLTAMVARLTEGKSLPPKVLDQLLAKADGVPLFLEELTKTVLESGLLADVGDRYELSGPLPPLAVPATLHDSLMARLDRLASVKEVAQIGAVVGREFSYQLLATLSPFDEGRLQEALSRLVGAELMFCRGVAPDATYRFKHALVGDAAYASLSRSKRQELHARIAGEMETWTTEATEAEPEILAHHLTEAGLEAKAIVYWHKAGQRAAPTSRQSRTSRKASTPCPNRRSASDKRSNCKRPWGLRS